MKECFTIDLFYQKIRVKNFNHPVFLKNSISLFLLFIFLFLVKIEVSAREYSTPCKIDGGVCVFGDDWEETSQSTGRDIKRTCIFGGGTANTSWIVGKKFICTGIGVRYLEKENRLYGEPNYTYPIFEGGVDAYEGWVVCNNSADGIPRPGDINQASDLIDRVFNQPSRGSAGSFKYLWKGGTNFGSINPKCTKCNSKNISSCPGYTTYLPPVVPTKCVIETNSNNCTFGDPQKNNSLANTNCVNTTDKTKNRKLANKNGRDYMYFCDSAGKSVECDYSPSSGLLTIDYINLFNTTDNQGTGEKVFSGLKSNYSSTCRYVEATRAQENCKLASTNDSDLFCKFGPLTSNNSSAYKNCHTLKATEGQKNIGGRYLYCSPEGKKIVCDRDTSYTDLFNVTYNPSDGMPAFSSSALKSDAVRNNGCKIYTISTNECNVTATVTEEGNCIIPEGCYNKNSPVRATIGEEKVGLYCISKSATNTREGYIYSCPADMNGAPFGYDLVTDLNTNGRVSLKSNITVGSIQLDLNKVCKRYINREIQMQLRKLSPLSPINLIKTVSTTLYYFAIFYFIVLILINAFSYVRSGEDPSKLKQIKESLFNTIAGFIFVIASGGVIVYLINQLS